MEELLALYGIRSVVYYDNVDVRRTYAFTSEMAARNIFIEFYDTDEAGEEEEENDEVRILNDDDEMPDHGSQMSVIMEHENKYYQFLLYDGAYEIAVPIMQIQTINFLVELIEPIPSDRLVRHLTTLSTDPLIPHLIEDKEHRELAVTLVKSKILTVHELIKESNAGFN